jgi:hypothetical protein
VIEAQAAWEGFLWSPRLYRPLLAVFKRDFLETVRHYAELGDHGQQYAAILTYAALDPTDTFTTAELSETINLLPQEGLHESVQTLVHSLEGAGDQREAHWANRIQLFWLTIWPQSRDLASQKITEQLVRLTILAGDAFPSAVAAVRDWLLTVEHPNFLLRLLYNSELCSRYPQDALTLLDAIISDQTLALSDLSPCLSAIEEAWSEAQGDSRYQRLKEYARLQGQD